jgi:cell wall-associated NlpC family hydrolase
VTTLEVVVDVATGWTAPTGPREIDAPAIADQPDLAGWMKSLDGTARLGLHGRTLTQLVRGEPALLIEQAGEWVQVAAPWQPAPEDVRGYPCWVRRAHLVEAELPRPPAPANQIDVDKAQITQFAGQFVGLPYLWGGTSRWGLDCSGLVHLAHRAAGVVVPRDAAAQQATAMPVQLGEEQPGDLYFFARDDRVFHVGFVTGPGRMLHAPEDGSDGLRGTGCIEDVPLSAERRETLSAAGRFL